MGAPSRRQRPCLLRGSGLPVDSQTTATEDVPIAPGPMSIPTGLVPATVFSTCHSRLRPGKGVAETVTSHASRTLSP